ncbi:MAG TPA: aldo/keto reductase [Candidatus Thermoplasmatota archaeon]
MRRRAFGSTGIEVPVIGQGTWKLKRPDNAERALRLGLELGLTHIDTAELYRGSEEVVCRAIASRREQVFLVSKVLPTNASYAGTLDACDRSLERLKTDHLDVYLLHWWSSQHSIQDTMRAMGDLVDAKKIRFVGVSNLSVSELEEAQSVLGRNNIICDQVYYAMDVRNIENELLPYCKSKNIAVVGYSPFGSGNFPSARTTRGGKVLEEIAKERGLTPHQVVLAFLAREDNVFLIPKAETEAHVRENASALERPLTQDDVDELDAAFPRGRSTQMQYV